MGKHAVVFSSRCGAAGPDEATDDADAASFGAVATIVDAMASSYLLLL